VTAVIVAMRAVIEMLVTGGYYQRVGTVRRGVVVVLRECHSVARAERANFLSLQESEHTEEP